ncbi:MAG: hypothetical protein ACLP8Y_06930 [Thermoplasmata archaeon]
MTKTRIAHPDRLVNWTAGVLGFFLGTIAGLAAARWGGFAWSLNSPVAVFFTVGLTFGIAVFFLERWFLTQVRLTPALTPVHKLSSSAGMLWIESPGSRTHWISLADLRLSDTSVGEDWYSVTFPWRRTRFHVFYIPGSVASRLRSLLPPAQGGPALGNGSN